MPRLTRFGDPCADKPLGKPPASQLAAPNLSPNSHSSGKEENGQKSSIVEQCAAGDQKKPVAEEEAKEPPLEPI
jgi:hypothetical protein